MERKVFPGYVMKIDADQGIVEHLVAVMGNVDLGGDIIHNGAFTKTIVERGAKIKVLDAHLTESTSRVIGKPLALREIGRDELPASLLEKYPDATGALAVKTQFLMDTQSGKEAFIRIKAGAVDEWSIGYDPVDMELGTMLRDSEELVVRHLRTLKLYEYSPVIWGMNPAAMTLSAKAASGKAGLPLAARDDAWDGKKAESSVREWAGGADNMDWAKYRQAFFWYDSAEPELMGSYKLGFAEVRDGKLTAVPKGIFAAAGAVQGARSPLKIPAADLPGVKGKIGGYYGAMRKEFEDDGIVVPWDKQVVESDDKATKALSLSRLLDEIRESFDEQFNVAQASLFGGEIPYEKYSWVTEVFDSYVIACRGGEYFQVPFTTDAEGEISFSPEAQWVSGSYVFTPGMKTTGLHLMESKDSKVGRVLSRRNADKISAALDALTEVLKTAGIIPTADDGDETASDEAGPDGDGKSFTPPTSLLELDTALADIDNELKLLETAK